MSEDVGRVDWSALALAETDPEAAMGADYWRQHAGLRQSRLKPLGRPCHDCAVVCGFYTALSIDLARQPAEIVDQVCGNWFCHSNPGRACRGNIEMVRYLRDSDEHRDGEDGNRLSGDSHASAGRNGIAPKVSP